MVFGLEYMKNKNLLLIVAFLIFCNLVALTVFWDLKTEREFEVVFFDVGQGDATLIKTKAGHNILIDGGPQKNILPALSRELSFWDRYIDLIILSHTHADHFSGLIEVIKRYNTKKIIWNGQPADSLIYKEWEELIKNEKTKIGYKGQRISFEDGYIDILYPPKEHQFREDLNEGSIINRLVHSQGGAILFTGDVYKAQERQLLNWEEECFEENYNWCKVMVLDADILKAGHHGSSSSSDFNFVSRVDPQKVLISAGKDNRYGHPHKEVLETFRNLGIDIHKTYRDGNLRVVFSD